MSANLFQIGWRTGDWTNAERAELYAVLRLIRASGQHVDLEDGISDEGDPWCVIHHVATGEVIAHVARLDGRYVVDSMVLPEPLTGRNLRECARRFLDQAPLPPQRMQEGAVLRLHPGALLAGLFLTLTMLVQSRIEPDPFVEGGADTPAPEGLGVATPLHLLSLQLLGLFEAAQRGDRQVDAGGAGMISLATIMAGVIIADSGLVAVVRQSDAPTLQARDDVWEAAVEDDVAAATPPDGVAIPAPMDGNAATLAADAVPEDSDNEAAESDASAVLVMAERSADTALLSLEETDTPVDARGGAAGEAVTTDGSWASDGVAADAASMPASPAEAQPARDDFLQKAIATDAWAVVDVILFRDGPQAEVVYANWDAPAHSEAPAQADPVASPPTVDVDAALLVQMFVRVAGEIYIFSEENGVSIYDSEILEGFDRGPHIVREITFADDSVITLTGFVSDFDDLWV